MIQAFRAPQRPSRLAWGLELGVVLLILILAVAVRRPLAETPGFTADVHRYMERSWKAATYGVGEVYRDSYDIPPTNNLPGLVYIFQAVGVYHRTFIDNSFPPPTGNSRRNPDHRFLLRIPPIAADLLTGLLVYASARRRAGPRRGLALLAGHVFNPALIFVSAYAGQTQSIYILGVVAAFVALEWRYPSLAWLALALAAGTKPQSWPFLPLLAVLTYRQFGFRKLAQGGVVAALVGLLLLAPIFLNGDGPDFLNNMFFVSEKNNDVNHDTHNVWWLAVEDGDIRDTDPFPPLESLGVDRISYRHIGLGMFSIVYLLSLIALWRRPDPTRVYLWAAFAFTGFVILSTNMHQWYLVGALPLLALALAEAPGWLWLYVVLSITSTVNQALHYPEIMRWLVPAAENTAARDAALRQPRSLNALVNVVVFLLWTLLMVWPSMRAGRRVETGLRPAPTPPTESASV